MPKYLGMQGQSPDRSTLSNDVTRLERRVRPLAWQSTESNFTVTPSSLKISSGPILNSGPINRANYSATAVPNILTFQVPFNNSAQNATYRIKMFHGLGRIPMDILPLILSTQLASMLIPDDNLRLTWDNSTLSFDITVLPHSGQNRMWLLVY